jgi:hypothetical protein
MITVNSLSGGKTSSYLEANYPADLSLFALVCLDSHNGNAGSKTFKVDAHVRKVVNDKLQKYCSHQHEFLSTAEDPIIIKTMLDLEQHTGREITWLRGQSFESLVDDKGMLPNKQHRWCTTRFKIQPIFEHLLMYHTLPCKMRIGYRADEAERVNGFKDTFIYQTHSELAYAVCGDKVPLNYRTERLPYINKYGIASKDYYRGVSHPHRSRWKEVAFRVGEFPLIEDGIDQADVQRYWRDKDVPFAEDSNCQFCFWKHPQQLRKNFDAHPGIMNSAIYIEYMKEDKSTFHHSMSMLKIRDIAPQMDLFQMRGGSCQGGYCTD